MIKIKRRYIGISVVISLLLALFFGYGWVNNMVSYKYEVQDFLKPGLQPNSGLDSDQLEIIHALLFCKYAMIACLLLLVGLLVINEKEPSFKGRIQWV
ncbi:hypothetical protein HYN43_024585 [Mucilaginibacter celer]|uniref:DUF998 domain-containing protein n=1 Tax=Mucilaginibacter celer TaxID=2305508 RepID=A0A494VTI1_9SPHI|nr:hypothetical protein HYN43_024585 [Mucilaginibacter celer]